MFRRLTALLLAPLACAVLAAPASAGGISGNWAGETSQKLTDLEHPYTTKIGFTTYKGRVIMIVGEVRMECGETAVMDARVVKSYRTGKGPKLSSKGSFRAKANGVKIHGRLTRRAGSGSISAAKADCSGKGTWSVKRLKV
jgi:hypothetical protein